MVDREPKPSKIDRRYNPQTQGAVTSETDLEGRLKQQARLREEIEDELSPGRHLAEGETQDWYGGRGRVKIERAASDEIDNKKSLDDAVDDENRYPSDEGRKFRGLPPCQERKRRWWG